MSKRLKCTDRISDLAKSPLLDDLSGSELVVYLRLLAATGAPTAGRARVLVTSTNADLYARDPRTVVRALRHLEELKLIAIQYDVSQRPGRTIEVLR